MQDKKPNKKTGQGVRILAYTDSSTSDRYACCAYIVLNDTEGTFLHSNIHYYQKVSSTQAELLAILNCVTYLADNHPGCRVSVFSDAQSIVDMWNLNQERLDKINYSELFIKLAEKTKYFLEFNLEYVEGHSDAATPNKLCDLISRRYRRLHRFITTV